MKMKKLFNNLLHHYFCHSIKSHKNHLNKKFFKFEIGESTLEQWPNSSRINTKSKFFFHQVEFVPTNRSIYNKINVLSITPPPSSYPNTNPTSIYNQWICIYISFSRKYVATNAPVLYQHILAIKTHTFDRQMSSLRHKHIMSINSKTFMYTNNINKSHIRRISVETLLNNRSLYRSLSNHNLTLTTSFDLQSSKECNLIWWETNDKI